MIDGKDFDVKELTDRVENSKEEEEVVTKLNLRLNVKNNSSLISTLDYFIQGKKKTIKF